jgi:hypothetical protein
VTSFKNRSEFFLKTWIRIRILQHIFWDLCLSGYATLSRAKAMEFLYLWTVSLQRCFTPASHSNPSLPNYGLIQCFSTYIHMKYHKTNSVVFHLIFFHMPLVITINRYSSKLSSLCLQSGPSSVKNDITR